MLVLPVVLTTSAVENVILGKQLQYRSGSNGFYDSVGDIRWVQEEWRVVNPPGTSIIKNTYVNGCPYPTGRILYKALNSVPSGPTVWTRSWNSPFLLPPWLARIVLRITNVRRVTGTHSWGYLVDFEILEKPEINIAGTVKVKR